MTSNFDLKIFFFFLKWKSAKIYNLRLIKILVIDTPKFIYKYQKKKN